jgi:CheY-like chemotaxis protein
MTQSVLIVDDELGLADIAVELLTEAGYDVVLAINGQRALAILATRRADIVVTDLMMPVMDGPEMIRRMRADASLAEIPTILMTALPDAVPTGDAALHDAVLVKPFGLQELLDAIRRLLPPVPPGA